MIIMTEVAQKLESILNGTDSETSGLTNPTGYYFQVETEGFHIDHIKLETSAGNFIPVFISSMGGQFNPVKGLKQGSYSIPIIFYYPVRFKDDFYALGEFLVEAFVGTILNYGTISGKAVSNISVPQYGEIQNLDFREFKNWVEQNYTRSIEVMEPYMTMQLTLYLSNAANGLFYGNDIKTSLKYFYDGEVYKLDDVDIDGASLQSNSQAQSEQEEGTNESTSLPFGTTYGSSIKIYPNLNTLTSDSGYYPESGTYSASADYWAKSGSNYIHLGQLTEPQYNAAHAAYGSLYLYRELYFYKQLLKIWLLGEIQTLECVLTFTIAGDQNLKYSRLCYIQSVVAPIEKGQLFSLTLTLAHKTTFEEDED